MSAPDMPNLDSLAFATCDSGLRLADIEVGEGEEYVVGSNAVVHYTGWFEDGNKFDSSVDRGDPFVVEDVGRAPVIEGWNQGLQGMKVGGTRVLVIPHELGYGAEGMPGAIPPAATLVFLIQAVGLK